MFLYAVLHDIPNGGITNFFSQLIVNFGSTSQQRLLYGLPGGAVVILACLINGFVGGYFRQRTIVACVPLLCTDRNAPDHRSAYFKQRRPLNRVLYDAGTTCTVCDCPVTHLE